MVNEEVVISKVKLPASASCMNQEALHNKVASNISDRISFPSIYIILFLIFAYKVSKPHTGLVDSASHSLFPSSSYTPLPHVVNIIWLIVLSFPPLTPLLFLFFQSHGTFSSFLSFFPYWRPPGYAYLEVMISKWERK